MCQKRGNNDDPKPVIVHKNIGRNGSRSGFGSRNFFFVSEHFRICFWTEKKNIFNFIFVIFSIDILTLKCFSLSFKQGFSRKSIENRIQVKFFPGTLCTTQMPDIIFFWSFCVKALHLMRCNVRRLKRKTIFWNSLWERFELHVTFYDNKIYFIGLLRVACQLHQLLISAR